MLVSKTVLMLAAWLLYPASLLAQDSTVYRLIPFHRQLLKVVNKKAARLENTIVAGGNKTLHRLALLEKRLKKKSADKNSIPASQKVQDAQNFYAALKKFQDNTTAVAPHTLEYIPFLDSIITCARFLRQSELIDDLSASGTLESLDNLQYRLLHADQLHTALLYRLHLLRKLNASEKLARQLRKYYKRLWYYRAQLTAYKSMFSNPHHLERKALDALKQYRPFREFMGKHSMLGTIFGYNHHVSGGAAPVPIQGLQTRVQVASYLQHAVGKSGNTAALIQQRSDNAQQQLTGLKEKLNTNAFSNSDASIEMPTFKVNRQRLKSFWHRWELGTNVQSKRGSTWLPATSDLAITAAYKLNDQSLAGIGLATAVGWGKDIRNITMSYEGIGARSFLDWKLKGSIWISGGFELNYRQSFSRIEQLKQLDAWQESALVGLSKQFPAGKKIRGDVRLLWDMLSYRQLPQSQAFIFRIGYSLK